MAKPVILAGDDPQALRVMGRDTSGRKRAAFFARTPSIRSKALGHDGRGFGDGPGIPGVALGRVFAHFHMAGRSEPGEARFTGKLPLGSKQNGGL
jgi:hypothetical protein